MNYKPLIILLLSIIFTSHSFSQYQKSSQEIYIIKGTVVEKETNKLMEYCTVSLYSKKDSSLATGGLSDFNGNFSLQTKKPGKYFLKISYIGFETSVIDPIVLNSENKIFDVSTVFLSVNAHTLKDVEIVGEKTTIRYEMDKKIIDVGKDISASNGSAVDVLENTPSIDVDIDGTVKLRGSSNFQVLINGKPSILSGKEALQQIPASNIKNIELITNPSAKYEAGNSSGIINIILKKEKKIGTSGMIRLSYGTFNNYNASINIKHNIKKFSFNFSASTRNYNRPRNATDSLHTSFNEVNTTISKGLKTWAFGGYSFNYGIDYHLHKNHSINFDFVVGKWTMDVNGEETINHKNETLQTEENYKYANDQERFADYFGPSLSYNGSFKNKSTLATYIGYAQRDFKEKVTNKRLNNLDVLDEKDKTTETGFRQNITAKIDYSLPIKTGKLELGGKTISSWNDEKNNEFIFDTLSNNYRLLDYNNRNISYTQKVYGLYTNYSNKWKKISFSLGFRAEYTDREILIKEEDKNYSYYKWNYFPSASLSYSFTEKSQIYTSYSRRIRRFPSYFLEPTPIKTGATSYFQGNPNLKPKISNSFELGFSTSFKKSTTLAVEVFYKLNTDEYQFISSAFEDSISTLQQPYNIGTSQHIGTEINSGFKILKWWKADLMWTGYYESLNGAFEGQDFNKNSFVWHARINNNFTITKNTKLQFSGNYRSKRITVLGNYLGSLSFDIGLKQSFLKKALNVTFNMKNVFYTAQNESTTSYKNYYLHSKTKISWPFLTVGLSYTINNYRPTRRQTEDGKGSF